MTQNQLTRNFSDDTYSTARYGARRPLLMVPLPRSPQTTSPVPQLTSLYSIVNRGPYGRASYPGNCSGYLIRDLLRYFGAKQVLDPMTGSGTCRDVCRAFDIDCISFDVKSGQDACQPQSYEGLPPCDFVWLHPPYWRMIRYSEMPACLSNAATIEEFQNRLRSVVTNCLSILAKRGKIAILMGDYFDRQQRRQMPLAYFTKQICLELGLWPACTDIVRFQHGNTSSSKSYNRSFIPGLHDICMVMQRS
ncbi:MAG: hypothetical protein L0228_04120 [Planctomycetes bacterium]|nr:hypothetical protein [Planctomycetota bacterium]